MSLPIHRRLFALLTLAACAGPAFAAQPNVVLIITDDAGWADYGFMRAATAQADPGAQGAVPTPNLDRIAADGVTFTNAYTGSVCAPSRAMIVTGQYGTRFGFGTNTGTDISPINQATIATGVPTEETTIFERMQSAGYDTAAFGKWHIGSHSSGGGLQGNRPEHQGVEHFEGLWGGSRGYFAGSATSEQALRRTLSDGMGGVTQNGSIESQFAGQYVTDILGDLTVDYVRDQAQNDSDPFFAYMSFTAPHTPMEATAADLAYIDSLGIPGVSSGRRRDYAAMQHSMDRNVGKLLDALEDPNGDGDLSDSVMDNTMLLFINDNGGDCCDTSPNSADNGDLRNGKGSQFEGGMRVPMIVAGAGVNAAARGTVSADLVHSIDLLPTAFAGAGGGTFEGGAVVDGKNLLPHINGEIATPAHEDLFISRYANQQSAVRKGKWKYMYRNNEGYSLFDLDADINESNNVVGSPANAAVAEEMHQLMASYHVQMEKPRVDNNAPATNQFDHFRFREEALSAANYSTASAWVDGGAGGAAATAMWRDGYASNRLTFRAKASGDYSVTNDLRSWGGFAYMANRLSLDSATAPIVGENTATLRGLPLLLANSLAGEAPSIELNATDAAPGAFRFRVEHAIEVYDDATITGDGNQRFEFGGAITEFRPGRSLTKSGNAEVTFAGGLAFSGGVDFNGGRVAVTGGDVRGDVAVGSGTTLQVGERGFTPGTPGIEPPQLAFVTDGLEFAYNAALDLSGDSQWDNSASAGAALSFSGPASTVPAGDATYARLTAAYPSLLTGPATGLTEYFENAGPRSKADAAFEVVFRVADDSAGSDQVIFEAGGRDRGVAFVLNDGVLTFNVDGDNVGGVNQDFNLTAPVAEGWRHAVGVIDLEGSGDTISLYVDNQLVGTTSGLTIDDWAGGNPVGVGAGFSSVTGVSSGTGAPFHGDVALVRYYNQAFGATEVDTNHQWLLQAPPGGGADGAFTLTIDGGLDLRTGARLELDIATASEHDRVDATGAVVLGGDLAVETTDGFAAQLGDVYRVVTGSAVTGEFAAVELPELAPQMMWQLRYLANEVLLVTTIAGDFNGDGSVDAADYTVWRDMLGATASARTGADATGDGQVTQADLSVWQANFGMSVELTIEGAVIPEPPTVANVAAAVLLLLGRTGR